MRCLSEHFQDQGTRVKIPPSQPCGQKKIDSLPVRQRVVERTREEICASTLQTLRYEHIHDLLQRSAQKCCPTGRRLRSAPGLRHWNAHHCSTVQRGLCPVGTPWMRHWDINDLRNNLLREVVCRIVPIARTFLSEWRFRHWHIIDPDELQTPRRLVSIFRRFRTSTLRFLFSIRSATRTRTLSRLQSRPLSVKMYQGHRVSSQPESWLLTLFAPSRFEFHWRGEP